jgi:RHS repeat-associated protein
MNVDVNRRRCPVLVVLIFSMPALSSTWFEVGNSGALPSTAQVPVGTGPLTLISGFTSFGDFEDLYRIRIDEPVLFSATTDPSFDPAADGDFDTQLFLMDENGFAVLANNDCAGCVGRSYLAPPATDGTGATIPGPGIYYIGITGFPRRPVSPGGNIFDIPIPGGFTEISGPDGPGAGQPMTDWAGSTPENGFYAIALTGCSFAAESQNYDCTLDGCVPNDNGDYPDIEFCDSGCVQPPLGFTCIGGSFCGLQLPGDHFSFLDCAAECGLCFGVDCDDMDPTTEDSCDPFTGDCINEPIGMECDDGDLCTTDMPDGEGGCVYTPVDCDDGLFCTDDMCDPATGDCINTSNCDDGNACTTDNCIAIGAGSCSFLQITCDDGLDCTDDSCDPETGCVFTPNCDDGDPCTDDICDPDQGCIFPFACDDGNACTLDTCFMGNCGSFPLNCDDGDPCTDDSCDPEIGCVYTSTDCDDGNACTFDGCLLGECVYLPVACDDSNPCTDDSCDPETGCVYTPINCDDENACTFDSCLLGSCVQFPVICNDGSECTDDSCDPVMGCVFTPNDCEDGDLCTVDTCLAEVCLHAPISCDDFDACTVDECDPETGECNNIPIICFDSDNCTSDSCNPEIGECEYTPIDCDDGNGCTIDECVPETGQCNNIPITCFDGNNCTTDMCDPVVGGCVFTVIDCNDGNECTIDECEPGTGECSNIPIVCSDGLNCTMDMCDSETGDCVFAPIDCDDGDLATLDICVEPQGCQNTPFAIGISELLESPPDEPPAKPTSEICTTCEEMLQPNGTDSVNLFSGELFIQSTDLFIEGRELDFELTRTYASRRDVDSAVGNNWDFSYNIFLEEGSGTNVVVNNGAARRDEFVDIGGGKYVQDEFFSELTENPDGTFTMTFSDTGMWNFNAMDGTPEAGRIATIQDRNGNTQTFDYDETGQLTTVTDSLDRNIDFEFDLNGNLTRMTDFAGRQVTYEYFDGVEAGGNMGDLKSVTTPAVTGTPNGNDFPDGKTVTYTYSTGFADERLNSNLLTVTDPKGQTYLTNTYAATENPAELNFDRVQRQNLGNPGEVIDYVYVAQTPDEENRFAVLKTIINNRMGNVAETFYNDRNQLVLQIDFTGQADPQQPTTDTDNRPMNPLRPSDPTTFVKEYEYNDDGNITRTVHPNGNESLQVFQVDLDPNAPRRSRGNLIESRQSPGTHTPVGDQSVISQFFEYDDDFGGCCGSNFVTRHVDANGNETNYEYDDSGNRTRTIHRIPSIVEDFEYNEFGQLTAQVHPDNGSGHRRRDEVIYYDTGPQTGYVFSQTKDAGENNLITTFEYDSVGNTTGMVDPNGNESIFIVNERNQIVQSTTPETEFGSGVRYQRTFFYDLNDNLVRQDIENRNDEGVIQPNSQFTTIFEYEILNNVTRRATEINDFSGAIPGTVDSPTADGLPEQQFVVIEFEYDANRNQTRMISPEAVDGRQPENQTFFLYDERDLTFQTIQAPGTSIQSTSQFDYDPNANVTRTVHGLEDTNPREMFVTIDGYDRKVNSQDSMGNTIEFEYDANNNQTRKTQTGELFDTFPSGGAPPEGGGTEVRLQEMAYEYDDMDRLAREIIEHFDTITQAPIGDGQSITTYDYSDFSQITLIEDDRSLQKHFSYDSANRLTLSTDEADNQITMAYDANSNIIEIAELDRAQLSGSPDETFVHQFEYDGLNRLTRTIDNAGDVREFAFDSRDNNTLMIDALRPTPGDPGNVVRYGYDGLNRNTGVTRFLTDDGTGTGAPAGQITTTQLFDDNSRLVATIDELGNATRQTFDAHNRLAAVQHADGSLVQYGSGLSWPLSSTPDFAGFISGYDALDNVRQLTDQNGTTTQQDYDLLNRLTNTAITPGPGVSTDTTIESYTYDGLSRLVQATDNDSTVELAYDSMSNRTAETLNGKTTTSLFDGVRNRVQCIYPGTRQIDCTFDLLNRVDTISDTTGLIASYDYVGPDRTQRRMHGNDTHFSLLYDSIKRVTNTTHQKEMGEFDVIFDARQYSWDAMHNKLSRQNLLLGGATHTYQYDSIYRMTSADTNPGTTPLPAGTNTYTYDGAGNRVATTGQAAGSYVRDNTNPPMDAPVHQYTITPMDRREYDHNGNLAYIGGTGDFDSDGDTDLVDFGNFQLCFGGTGVIVSEECKRFDGDGDGDVDLVDFGGFQLIFGQPVPAIDLVYDYRNRLVELVDGVTGIRHTYQYDVFGRRIARTLDADGAAQTTAYYYDSWNVCEERNDADSVTATYVHGRGIDEVINMQRTGSDYFYHTDDSNNTMVLTDGTGTVVERYDYDDFGGPVFFDPSGTQIPASTVENPYLFKGRRYDDETGFYYNRARYYEPATGRFISRDPLGIWTDGMNIGNGFTYSGNNPWTHSDPTGLKTKKECQELITKIRRHLNDWQTNTLQHIQSMTTNSIMALEKLLSYYNSPYWLVRFVTNSSTNLRWATTKSVPTAVATVIVQIVGNAVLDFAESSNGNKVDYLKSALLKTRDNEIKQVSVVLKRLRKQFDEARKAKGVAGHCCPKLESFYNSIVKTYPSQYKSPPPVVEVYGEILIKLAGANGWTLRASKWNEKYANGYWHIPGGATDWPYYLDATDIADELNDIKYRPKEGKYTKTSRP